LHEVVGQAELTKGRNYSFTPAFTAALTPAFTPAFTTVFTIAHTAAFTTVFTAAFTAAYWQEWQTHTKCIPKSVPTRVWLMVGDNNRHSVHLHQVVDTTPTQMQEQCGKLLETTYG